MSVQSFTTPIPPEVSSFHTEMQNQIGELHRLQADLLLTPARREEIQKTWGSLNQKVSHSLMAQNELLKRLGEIKGESTLSDSFREITQDFNEKSTKLITQIFQSLINTSQQMGESYPILIHNNPMIPDLSNANLGQMQTFNVAKDLKSPRRVWIWIPIVEKEEPSTPKPSLFSRIAAAVQRVLPYILMSALLASHKDTGVNLIQTGYAQILNGASNFLPYWL